jgi:hypothetical protein
MKRILLRSLMLLLLPVPVLAQQMEGIVRNEKGAVIESATVYNRRSGTHTHTNAKGIFILNQTRKSDTLQINFIGYENQLILVNQPKLEVILKEVPFELKQVVISPHLKSLHSIADINLNLNPVKSSQEVLRIVPGLFIGQHAGGGKAEQIFLRGFDIDHGTDINIMVDGIPVNMVSHAHGQGYADLHFLIPETIEKIDFGKGPYYANRGNFTTAGYVELHTFDKLDESSFSLEYGDFNTLRTVGLIDLTSGLTKHDAYLASEYSLTDGPFESPQNFNRLNLMGKYSGWLTEKDKLNLQASVFKSRWDASGQIPLRAVNQELISRFGAIDDTEGGETGRANLAAELTHMVDDRFFIRNKLFFSHYDFELYSNFTFFLEDPANGDQIRQKEQRNIFGFESLLDRKLLWLERELDFQAGIGLRSDQVSGNELSRTANRKVTLENISLGNVHETNLYAFANAEFKLGKWLISPALRFDYFDFLYENQLLNRYTPQSENKGFISPKLNISYSPSPYLQFYLKNGIGFHSNDTRVVVAQEGEQILPAAYGSDLGLSWKPVSRLMINSALWYLFLEQEFVYVGDAGIVEPSGKTARKGVEIGLKYQLLNWLFLDTDLSYAHARAVEEPEGTDYIPLAPDFTAAGGLSFMHPKGISGSLRYRYMDDRPANEDNSVVATGYFITDLNVNYSRKSLTYSLSIENLFNQEWMETQFDTESRLSFEENPVSEIHFTPGTPFFLKGKITYRF